MAAVDIGIGHDDDLVIAQLVDVELIPDAGAERDDQRVELVVAVDLVGARLFDVEHLAPHRQDRLEAAVAALDGRARGAVALDDVDLAQRRVALVAVLQLVGHLAGLQPRLAAHGFLGLARGLAGAVGHHGLLQNGLCRGRVLLEIGGELVVYDAVDQRADIGVAQLLLGLALKLGLGQLDGNDGGDALAHVLAGDLVVALDDVGLGAVGVDHAGERGLEAGLVHAALGGVDVVGEGDDVFIVAVVVLQRDLGDRVALRAGEIDHVLVQGGLVFVEEGDKFTDAALVVQHVLLLLALALVLDRDGQAAV